MSYANTPMERIGTEEYDALLVHLGEQLTAAMLADGWPGDDAPKAATDALAVTFDNDLTGNEWLAAAGKRLGVDTSSCIGA